MLHETDLLKNEIRIKLWKTSRIYRMLIKLFAFDFNDVKLKISATLFHALVKYSPSGIQNASVIYFKILFNFQKCNFENNF